MVMAVVMMMALGAGTAVAGRSCFSVVSNLPGLKLTNEQETKLSKTETEHCKKMIRMRAELSVAKLEKQVMLRDKNFKEEAVQKQIKKIMDIKTDMQMARLAALTELRNVLTDEQWEQFSSYVGKRGGGSYCKKCFGCGRQHWGNHRQGGQKERNFDCGMVRGPKLKNCPYSDPNTKMDK